MKLKETKDNKRSMKIIVSIAIIAVIFVPMLYSCIYLLSVWDVYNKLDNVPVAFVNMDKSTTKDGKEYSLGKEIGKNLKDNKKVSWRFVTQEEAMEGVKGTKYYAVVEIPEDFSENIANVQSGNTKNSEIIYIPNKGKNFVFSQISLKAAEAIKTEVSSNIQKEVSKSLVNSLYDVKVSIKDAGNGVEKLQVGTEKLLNGSERLADGAESAANGSVKLQNALNTATVSVGRLQDGTQELFDGSSKLTDGLDAAVIGSKKLSLGLMEIANGQSKIVNGSETLVTGLKTAKSSLTQSNNSIKPLINGASALDANVGAIAQGAGQLDTSFGVLADSIKKSDSVLHYELDAIKNSNLSQADKQKLIAGITALDKISISNTSDSNEAPISKAANSIHQLSSNLDKLKTGSSQISNGVNTLADGLSSTQSKLDSGLDKLIGGAEGIQTGSSSVLIALNTVTAKTGELSNGLEQLNGGATRLENGLQAVNDGNLKLKNGLSTIGQKTGELSSGLATISNGAKTLNDGLHTASEGTTKLRNGLNSGYDKMDTKLKFSSDSMSNFISKPVDIKENDINDVKYYGEGLAPYFISMSMWLGAMIIGTIISIAKSKKVFNNKLINSFFGSFVVGSGLVVLQALILSYAAIKIIGINPVSVLQFCIINSVIAITFFSVAYGVSHAIGALGGAVMFILLLLQLSSSAGTFPIETAPIFYRIVNRIVPMTYSVSTLRMTISGINQSVLNHNMLVMVIFIAVFLLGGFLIRELIDFSKNGRQAIMNSKVA